jgi:hypothetical protein
MKGEEMGDITDMRKGGCEDGWWMELAQGRIQRRDLVLALLQLSDSTSRELVT